MSREERGLRVVGEKKIANLGSQEVKGNARKRRTCYLVIATCYLIFGCHNPYMVRDLQPIIDARNPGMPITYTVTFDSMGGSSVPAQTVEEGELVLEPLTMPTKTSHSFGGWYKESECINEWDFAVDTVTQDITLYARWIEGGTVTVSLDVEEIIDGNIPDFDITLSRTGSGYPAAADVSVNEADYDAGSIRWEIAGAGAYLGEVVSGTGAYFAINATNVIYNTVGGHSLVIEVRINGIQYQRNILFTIVE